MTRPTPQSTQTSAAQALAGLRRKIDAFFGDPRSATLARQGGPAAGPRPPSTAAAALRSSLADILARLGAGDDLAQLDKSVLLHGGELVSMTGSATPMPPDGDVRVVTTTTTVLEAGRMLTETSVLVFAKGPR